jgi:hypothetical protein
MEQYIPSENFGLLQKPREARGLPAAGFNIHHQFSKKENLDRIANTRLLNGCFFLFFLH